MYIYRASTMARRIEILRDKALRARMFLQGIMLWLPATLLLIMAILTPFRILRQQLRQLIGHLALKIGAVIVVDLKRLQARMAR